ncbi:MAG: substrate-binding domain-containing protein [Bryobacteraceae bacterium]
MSEIQSNLAKLRRERGISINHLAEVAGVTRQTIHAIAVGGSIPNTAVALRLARVLETSVEELFSLPEDAPIEKPPPRQALFLPGSDAPVAGQPVQLCRIDKQLVASPPSPWDPFLPAADAVVMEGGQRSGKTKLELFRSEIDTFDNRILVAGCDPGLSVLARYAQSAGVELVLAHRNSSQALELLKAGCAHIAGTHLRDDASGDFNVPAVQRLFPKTSVAVISLAVWEQGIVTAASNPKGIRGIDDLARPDVRMVNREMGSGSRALLDKQLKKAGINASAVQGYDSSAPGHLPAAWQVHSGSADCCIATRAASRLFGLHFIPLAMERYDFAIRKQSLALPGMKNLLDILYRGTFRRELQGLAGYDTRVAGHRLL